ncbi:MAG TPA: hypothetical protein VGM05_06910 [Planctomycetaceae bacterium]
MTRLMGLILLLLAAHSGLNVVRAAEPIARRWVYLQTNLQVRENADKAAEILKRAAQAGYNGVVLADYKLNVLDRVPNQYFVNARQFKKIADDLKLEVIPTVAPIGYSDGLLAHDPNLAEGIPVRSAPFVVTAGVATLDSELKESLPGGTFEEHRNHVVRGWDFQDAADRASFVDTLVKHGGASSLRWEDPGRNAKEGGGNARVVRQIAVAPWRQYHASVWIRTAGYEAADSVRLFGMGGGGRVLSHSNLGVKRDQDWTQHHVIFNSLDNQEIRIYCGTWGGRGGTLWMDDLVLEETAFVNLLRRSGCPFEVTGSDGTAYQEGRDYAPVRDSRLGNVPWAGNFDVWHEPPRLSIPAGSTIRDGARLKVGFSHTVTVHDNQVTCCLAHPQVFETVEMQVREVEKLFSPRTYFLSHDEIRMANWCGSCRREGQTAGQLLAENAKGVIAAVRRVNPNAHLCIWSDMFDPHHNAHDGFYLVNGDLAGSWLGLPRDMTIVNWNHDQATKSLPFFAERGQQQVLAGYYDGDPQSIANWLKTGANMPGINGAMYTTWKNDFQHLEAFARAAWGTK